MQSIPVRAIQYWVHQNPTPCSNTTTQLLDLSWNWDTRPHAKYPCQGYTVLSPSKYKFQLNVESKSWEKRSHFLLENTYGANCQLVVNVHICLCFLYKWEQLFRMIRTFTKFTFCFFYVNGDRVANVWLCYDKSYKCRFEYIVIKSD